MSGFAFCLRTQCDRFYKSASLGSIFFISRSPARLRSLPSPSPLPQLFSFEHLWYVLRDSVLPVPC
jgi:hypothetical protein